MLTAPAYSQLLTGVYYEGCSIAPRPLASFRVIGGIDMRFTSLRLLVTCLCALIVVATTPVSRAESFLPKLGGPGGVPFNAPCPRAMYLVGVSLRTGNDVDGIAPLCASILLKRDAYNNISASAPGGSAAAYNGAKSGVETIVRCPDATPLVLGIGIEKEGADNVIINSIALFCGKIAPNQVAPAYPSAMFEGPRYTQSKGWLGVDGKLSFPTTDGQSCPAGQVANGVHGRNTARWLDAVGLICVPLTMPADPPMTPARVRSIGRLNSDTPAAASPQTQESICAAAYAARERNSPAAADLAARCGKPLPGVRSIGRQSVTGAGSNADQICASARDARDRNSPAAATLAERCKAAGGKMD